MYTVLMLAGWLVRWLAFVILFDKSTFVLAFYQILWATIKTNYHKMLIYMNWSSDSFQ